MGASCTPSSLPPPAPCLDGPHPLKSAPKVITLAIRERVCYDAAPGVCCGVSAVGERSFVRKCRSRRVKRGGVSSDGMRRVGYLVCVVMESEKRCGNLLGIHVHREFESD